MMEWENCKNKLNQSKLNSWIESNNRALMESKPFNLCWGNFLMSLSYMLKFEDIETQVLITKYLKFYFKNKKIRVNQSLQWFQN